MRKTVSVTTFQKVKQLFIDNPTKDYSSSGAFGVLKIDYNSLKLVLSMLLKEGFITQDGNRYKLAVPKADILINNETGETKNG